MIQNRDKETSRSRASERQCTQPIRERSVSLQTTKQASSYHISVSPRHRHSPQRYHFPYPQHSPSPPKA